jgi:hypothetical protein
MPSPGIAVRSFCQATDMERPVKAWKMRLLHRSPCVKHTRQRPRRELFRRLISLIFADRDKRAVMVVIRREPPRIRIAGLAHEPVA